MVTDEKQWFVLHYVSQCSTAKLDKYVHDFNSQYDEEPRLELFAPTYQLVEIVDGKIVIREKSLTYYYVFLKGTLADVKDFCSIQTNCCRFVLDNASQARYAIVSEEVISNLKLLARFYTHAIPFYDISGIDLEEGDLVEVVDGEYAGLIGTYQPKSRSNKGNLVIAAMANLGTIIWNVEAKYVRVLKFSDMTRRPYELIDAYLGKLLPILRKFLNGERLPEKDLSVISIFVRRMSLATVDNRKLEAKLAAALMCSCFILGEMDGYRNSHALYEKLKASVTNAWTQGMIDLLLYACDKDVTRLETRYESLADMSDTLSATQRQILDEYRHYLAI